MKNIHYINAGAGSGKTHSLTSILVRHIKEGKCKPSEILLTTFTELAAGEFRQRIYDRLVREGCLEQAASLDSATMGTLHSIALAYVQKYWYLLKRGTTVNVLPERDKILFINEAASRVLETDLKVLNEFEKCFLDGKTAAWITDICKILDQGYVFGIDDLEESREHSVSLIKKVFSKEPLKEEDRNSINELCRQYRIICGEQTTDKSARHLKVLDRAKEDCSFRTDYDLFKMFSQEVVNRDWKKLDLDNKKKIHRLLSLAIRSSSYGKTAAEACRCVFNAAVKVKKELQEYKESRGYIEYNDMEKLHVNVRRNADIE